MSNNVSQRSNKRKFHSIEYDCAFCNTWTSPNWECFCPKCTSITQEEMDETLKTSDFVQILRRANNVECECGLCATCIPDTQFSYTVYRHRISRTSCECPICAYYNADIAHADVAHVEVANVVSTQRKHRNRRILHRSTWQCFCPDCTDIETTEMEETLRTSKMKQFLRRASNCQCGCGVCGSCVSDAEFFYTVYRHKEYDEHCVCPFCRYYLHYLTTYFL